MTKIDKCRMGKDKGSETERKLWSKQRDRAREKCEDKSWIKETKKDRNED